MSFTVAIIGRPNVGKSTLYNRLLGRQHAIVDNISGVTRDRQYGMVEWGGKSFHLIDTGGFVEHSEDLFEKAIREQVHIAISEAALLLFMIDVTTGLTDLDDDLLRLLRKSEKDVFLLVNKVDNHQRLLEASEFYGLGIKEVFMLSSLSGSGTGDLLDAIIEKIPEEADAEEEQIPKFAIVGRPNVGKSTLLNALIGQERNIVTDIAGTTRDAIHSRYRLFNKDLLLIDTAGLRKKSAVMENLEFYSVIRAIKAIDEADVCLLLIDAVSGIENQDMAIFSLARRKKKGLLILVNKWDKVEKDTDTHLRFRERIRKKTAPFSDVPILFVSALNKQRIYKAMEAAMEVYEHRKQRISTSVLNEVMQKAIQKHNPPSYRGHWIKIKYIVQLPGHPPAFAFFCNYPQGIKEPYRNYLENQLREHFPLSGVPVTLVFRKK